MSTTADDINGKDHNLSSHQDVIHNDIQAHQMSHGYIPDHIHHDVHAEKGREDEVIYFPRHDLLDHDLHRRQHADMVKEPVTAIDPEQGTMCPSQSEQDPQAHTFSSFYKRYRIFFHLLVWIVFTGWWIAGLILHGTRKFLESMFPLMNLAISPKTCRGSNYSPDVSHGSLSLPACKTNLEIVIQMIH